MRLYDIHYGGAYRGRLEALDALADMRDGSGGHDRYTFALFAQDGASWIVYTAATLNGLDDLRNGLTYSEWESELLEAVR